MIYCDPELKEEIIKLHIRDGRTFKSLSDEFGFSADVISRWVKKYRQCAQADADRAKQLADMAAEADACLSKRIVQLQEKSQERQTKTKGLYTENY